MRITTERHHFSVAWGRNGSATKTFRPYADDAEAKSYRDAFAAVERRAGRKVRCYSMRGQRREFWGWQDPCEITCTVYVAEVETDNDALTSVEILPVPHDSGYRPAPPRTDAEIQEAEAFFAGFRLDRVEA